MKKFVAVLLAAVLCLSFAACGGDKATDKTVDAAAMFQALLTDVTYTDNATELDSSMAGVLLGGELPDGTEAYLAANDSAYLRCAVFACKDKDAAAAVRSSFRPTLMTALTPSTMWMKWRCCRMPRSTAWATM